jgi:ABC-type amino acid transport substrate-binding protein
MPKTPLSFYLHIIAVAVIVFAVGNYVSSRTPDRAEGSPSIISGDSSAAPRNDNRESVYDRVMRTGVIRCAYATMTPALSKDVNTQELSGYSYDLMQEIGRRLGLKIEWAEETPYSLMVESLQSKRVDVFCAPTGLNVHRAKFTLATEPFFYAPLFLAARTQDERFNANDTKRVNTEDIRLLVIDGDIAETIALNNFPKASRVAMPQMTDWPTMLQNVVSKKADVVIVEPYTFAQFDKNNPGQLRVINKSEPAITLPVGFPVNRDEPQLKYMLDMALKEIINEGFMQATLKKYFDNPNDYVFMTATPYQLPANKN